MDNQDYIICNICNEAVKTKLQFHLKNKHNISTLEYKTMFPGCSTISKNEYLRYVERNTSNKMRNIISERNKDPEFQKKCQAGCTEETRRIQSETMRKVSLECWKDPEYREKMSNVASETQKRENQKPDVIKRKSELSKSLWQIPEIATKMLTAPKKHPFGIQCSYSSSKFNRTYWCRSQGEYDFIKLCEDLGYVIDIISGEKSPIKYNDENNTEHIYLPDFIVYTSDQTYLIEVKYEGDSIENYKYKVNSAIDYCTKNNMIYCYVNRFSGISNIDKYGFNSVAVTQRI